MTRLRTAVIGVGHLGQHHARILSQFPDCDLIGVVDANPQQGRTIADKLGTRHYSSHQPLLDQVDAVTIVTPTVYHHEVAADFLRHGVPVLVEKPICRTSEEADDLIQLANETNTPFQVGHIERFNPAYEELAKRSIRPKFIEAERHGPYTGRSTDIGAVLDLMIHDLDLILNLVGGPVRDVHAMGAAVFGGHEDMVNARLVFESGAIAHVTASRISPKPKRRLRVWAPEGYAGIDFVSRKLTLVQPSDELRRNGGIHPERMDAVSRTRLKDELFGRYLQTMHFDGDRKWDQLTAELRHFIDCVHNGEMPRVSGEDGRDALALAERVLESVHSHSWEGADSPYNGPTGMPWPSGRLFDPPAEQDSEAA